MAVCFFPVFRTLFLKVKIYFVIPEKSINLAPTDSATPLSDAYQGGTFILYTMRYDKIPISFAEQLNVLRNRGLLIEDDATALRELSLIGYFRLANYMRPMEADKRTHSFKPGSTFENAVRLYYFDKDLRALLFTAIQSVEVALRSRMGFPEDWESQPLWEL